MNLEEKGFENSVEKGIQHFSFSYHFRPKQNEFKFFSHIDFVICQCFQFGQNFGLGRVGSIVEKGKK